MSVIRSLAVPTQLVYPKLNCLISTHLTTLGQLHPRLAQQGSGLTGGKDRRTFTPYCAVRGCGGYMLEK